MARSKFVIMELEVQDVVSPLFTAYFRLGWISCSLLKFYAAKILGWNFSGNFELKKGFSQVKVDEDEKPVREIKIIGAEHKKLTKPKVS